MKKFILTLILISFAAAAHAMTSAEIFQAMNDEMQRSMKQLKMPGMDKPYFMVYKAMPAKRWTYRANLGALIEENSADTISLRVSLRAGTPELDSSFFNSPVFSTAYQQYPALSYDAIRAAFWDNTNKAYKDALSILAKKKAYKESRNITENYPDFSPAKPAVSVREPAQPSDLSHFKQLAAALSAQANIKELDSFTVTVTAGYDPVYMLSSEGAKYVRDNNFVRIAFDAQARAKNGFELKETKTLFYALDDLPAKEELLKEAAVFARSAAALTKAEKIEAFIGPVLLEQHASAIFLEDIFTGAINAPRPVFSPNSDPRQGEFAQKLGLKVMPVWFDVYSDPAAQTYNNTRLAASYEVDDEGIAPQKLHLVTNGKLTALPTTRSLIKDQKTSSGHAVLRSNRRDLFAEGFVMNVFFIPQHTTPAAQFKDEFLQFCREEGLDYCHIVRASPLGNAFSAYKVDAETGTQTPVYGAGLKDLSTRALRDIKFAADDIRAYNLYNGAVSITAPSIVLGEAEIRPTQKLPARKPLVPRPI